MCKVCARSSPLRSTLNTSYIRFGHVSSMYRSSPLRSTLNTNVITHHSKSYIFPSKSKDLSPPAGSALFVRSTKTAGPRVFTMCQNIENHTDICKPWANYLLFVVSQVDPPMLGGGTSMFGWKKKSTSSMKTTRTNSNKNCLCHQGVSAWDTKIVIQHFRINKTINWWWRSPNMTNTWQM